MEEQTCSCCQATKQISEFYRDKQSKSGFSYHCKTCVKSRAKEHHVKNKERHNERDRKWHHSNKAKANSYSRAYQKLHKEELSVRQKAWREANKYTLKERYHDKYVKRREAVLAHCKEYVAKNKDKTNAYQAQYRKQNKPKLRAQIYEWHKYKLRTDPAFRILCNLRRRLTHAIKGKNKSASTVELLGCSVEYLMVHLENQFTDGMTWENYGEWHIDHKRPCALFDMSDPAQQRECFGYKNLQPLWGEDNQSKGARTNFHSPPLSCCAPG